MTSSVTAPLGLPLFPDLSVLGLMANYGKLAEFGLINSEIQRAIASLRARGSDAHLWLPGVGSVNGLTTGNYLESTGNTLATVDNPTGLVLDALGSVGVELVTNGGFDSDTGWTKGAGVTIGSGFANFAAVTNTVALYQNAGLAASKTYRITFTISSVSAGSIAPQLNGGANVSSSAVSAIGTYTAYLSNSASNGIVSFIASGFTGTIDNISVREVTGIHLTQGTTQNKPLLRRGLTNLLTYSSDFTNAAWVTEGTASKVGNVLNMPASPGDDVYHGTFLPAGTYTNAFVLSGSGTISLFCHNPTDNIFAVKQITLTATPTIYVNVASPTVANNIYYFGRRTGDTATSVTFGCGGLFQGTLTAAEILAAGGIPTTTTAAASNPDSGKYAWRFDGSNDSLALGSVPFALSDDWAVVASAKIGVPLGWSTLFGASGAGTTPRLQFYVNHSTGCVSLYLRDDAGANATFAGTTDVRNSTIVLSAVKVGSSVVIRVNGVQVAQTTSSLGVATFTGASLGMLYGGGDYFAGSIYYCNPIKGTLTDTELLQVERLAASAAGITI